jgi:hypothetical protein
MQIPTTAAALTFYLKLGRYRKSFLKEIILHVQALRCLKSLDDFFQNTETASMIMLTVTLTVNSREQSFSKFKIIKNYLRTIATEERPSDPSREKLAPSIGHHDLKAFNRYRSLP